MNHSPTDSAESNHAQQKLQTSVIHQRNLKADVYNYLSPSIKDITGWSVEEFCKFDLIFILDRVHPDDVDLVKRALARARDDCRQNGRSACVVEYRLRMENTAGLKTI